MTFKCNELPIIQFWNHSENADSVIWEFEGGAISNEWEPIYEFLAAGDKFIKAKILNEYCSKEITLPINIQPFFVPNVITPNKDGVNDKFEISTIYDIDLEIFNRWGRKLYEMQNYDNSWAGENLVAGIYYFNIAFADEETCTVEKGDCTII